MNFSQGKLLHIEVVAVLNRVEMILIVSFCRTLTPLGISAGAIH